ncbi:MAG: Secretion system C-terminal sorting domain [Fluviicola sp.]|jgi:hypothetical protein|uniref:T9SS type A sorting domain-containing protein n=1 Tax=Fluviicola sp. TaxID=1917219 RepID=UPI002631EADF|nr:T9SS type A sorting domain-containing protein [Fluviicola sp.]MDF3028998.1 Secretion system C-terminal sorting domain [Fluviicola sp.]
MRHHHTLFVSRIYLRLIITVLLSSPFSVSAQEETAFPNDYGAWQVESSWIEIEPFGYVWFSHLDQFEALSSPDSDTLMLLFDNGAWLGNCYSTADKMYFSFVSNDRPFNFNFQADTGVYYLLYDFSLEVGDTAYTDDLGAGPPHPVTVDSITMEEIYGVMLKHFYLSNSDIIVEKIGSLQGLFRPYSRSFEINQYLCSYYGFFLTAGLSTQYSYNMENCPSGLGLETNEMNAVNAYPNPANDKLTITTKLPVLEYHLYSAAGTVVEIPNVMQENKLELVVSGLPSGIYFLELKDRSGNSKMLHFIRN